MISMGVGAAPAAASAPTPLLDLAVIIGGGAILIYTLWEYLWKR